MRVIKRRKVPIGVGTVVVFVWLLDFWITPFLRNVPYPVPDSANWIRYYGYTVGGGGGADWLRFTVPTENSLPAAEALMEDFRKHLLVANPDKISIRRTDISPESPEGEIVRGPWWFKPHSIKKGFVLSFAASVPYRTTVWVDSQKGIVYQLTSD